MAHPHCFDTDPVNATFAQYQALAAEHINVLRRGAIHDKRFDELFEKICQVEGVCIVDTGATTFVPLWNYILENDILSFLAVRSRKVFVHTVVAGGQAMTDTLNGFERLAETTTEKNVIVWLNDYFGEVSNEASRSSSSVSPWSRLTSFSERSSFGSGIRIRTAMTCARC